MAPLFPALPLTKSTFYMALPLLNHKKYATIYYELVF